MQHTTAMPIRPSAKRPCTIWGSQAFASSASGRCAISVGAVVLLTDGEPYGGTITKRDEIVRAVTRMNHLRRVSIHCVSVSRFLIDNAFLKELSDACYRARYREKRRAKPSEEMV